jgi:hypothetical protein
MRLPETNPSVDEERVVSTPRVRAAGYAGRMRKLVCRAHHEVLEAVFGVEIGGLGGARRSARGARCRGRRRFPRRLGLLAQSLVELPADSRWHRRFAGFVLQRLENQVEVMRGNPLCEELIGDAEHDRIALDAAKLNRLQPGLEVFRRQVHLEAVQSLFPQSFHRHETPKKGAIQRRHPQAIHTSRGRAILNLVHQLPSTWRPPTGVF